VGLASVIAQKRLIETLRAPSCKAVRAAAEAEVGEGDAVLSTIDSAIALSERTRQRTYDAEMCSWRAGDVRGGSM